MHESQDFLENSGASSWDYGEKHDMAMAMAENSDVKGTTTLTTFCAGISILRAENRVKAPGCKCLVHKEF